MQRNINISGTRGRQVKDKDGGITYELDDGYTVLDDVKNTPRYWKKAKYEMLAKLENLGSFQFFFTISCADMRWEENFAAILRDQGMNMIYTVVPDEHGHHVTKIEVEFKKDDKLTRKGIKQYLDEDANTSIHELIRGNVLLATRYFNDRVKKFMNIIVTGDKNPMLVENYTYKVEFQDRGAGHIHGTLWLKLEMMEWLIRNEKDELFLPDKKQEKGPLKGISSAFKKLKNNEILDDDEKEALVNFIDEFTTVSTNENVVGADVSRMVLEVNKHCHTKTCRKYDCPCRFLYPRYPSTRTIIAEPIHNKTEKEVNELLKK